MNSILALAGNTVRELTRNKLLYLLVVFSILLILASLLLTQLSIGQWERVINDVSLATIQLSGAFVAILIGVGLVAGEVDRRTVYVTLSKPVSRQAFIVGKYLGLCATLAILVGVMGVALAADLALIGTKTGWITLAALILIYVELCMLGAFAMVFSSFTTQTLGVIFTACVFVIGHLTTDLAALTKRLTGMSEMAVTVLTYVLPNLDLLNLKTQAANGLPVAADFVVKASLYGFIYAGLAVAFAATLFARRDFK
jgi:ABC-type transport system involved in multi-copper enzyme maturation permease subunit